MTYFNLLWPGIPICIISFYKSSVIKIHSCFADYLKSTQKKMNPAWVILFHSIVPITGKQATNKNIRFNPNQKWNLSWFSFSVFMFSIPFDENKCLWAGMRRGLPPSFSGIRLQCKWIGFMDGCRKCVDSFSVYIHQTFCRILLQQQGKS